MLRMVRSHFLAIALLCVTLSACQTPRPANTPERASIVLTTDCGADMDDQWALAHILLSPELELKAVITSHAAAIGLSSDVAAENASRVIDAILPKQQLSRPQ